MKRRSPGSTSWPPIENAGGPDPGEKQEQLPCAGSISTSVVGNLARELDNTYVVDEHGNKRKLRRKGEVMAYSYDDGTGRPGRSRPAVRRKRTTTIWLLGHYRNFIHGGLAGGPC